MKNRNSEVLEIVINIFTDLNNGPDQPQPLKTIWLRAMKYYDLTSAREFNTAINEAVNEGLLSFTPGGVSGLGSVALTSKGYRKSRKRD